MTIPTALFIAGVFIGIAGIVLGFDAYFQSGGHKVKAAELRRHPDDKEMHWKKAQKLLRRAKFLIWSGALILIITIASPYVWVSFFQ